MATYYVYHFYNDCNLVTGRQTSLFTTSQNVEISVTSSSSSHSLCHVTVEIGSAAKSSNSVLNPRNPRD